jgi:hypothetical protein
MNFGDRISLPMREAGADGFLLGHIGPLIEHAGLSSGRTEFSVAGFSRRTFDSASVFSLVLILTARTRSILRADSHRCEAMEAFMSRRIG